MHRAPPAGRARRRPACRARCGPGRRARRRPRCSGSACHPPTSPRTTRASRWPRLRSASAHAERDVSMAIDLAQRVGRARGEHPDTGVGVDDEAGADELRAPPAARRRRAARRPADRTGRTTPSTPAAVAGDDLLEHRRRHRSPSPPATRGPRPSPGSQPGGQLPGRDRHPQRRLDVGVEPQRRQHRGQQRRVGDEARRRRPRRRGSARPGTRRRRPAGGDTDGRAVARRVDAIAAARRRGSCDAAGAAQGVVHDRHPRRALRVDRQVLPPAAAAAGPP